jgi:hypothetical protein
MARMIARTHELETVKKRAQRLPMAIEDLAAKPLRSRRSGGKRSYLIGGILAIQVPNARGRPRHRWRGIIL